MYINRVINRFNPASSVELSNLILDFYMYINRVINRFNPASSVELSNLILDFYRYSHCCHLYLFFSQLLSEVQVDVI